MRAITWAALGLLLVGVTACRDQEKAPDAAAQTEPVPQNRADTVAQRETFTPPAGLPDNPKAPPGTVGDGTVGPKVDVVIKDRKLTLSQYEMDPGPVTFIFNNTDTQQHILEINYAYGGRWRSVPVGRGGNVAMAQSFNAGPFEIFCAVPGHKDRGERATFVVK